MPGEYKARVTGRYKDCLTRQVREAVLIRRSKVPVLNSKTEWHQPALFQIQQELSEAEERRILTILSYFIIYK